MLRRRQCLLSYLSCAHDSWLPQANKPSNTGDRTLVSLKVQLQYTLIYDGTGEQGYQSSVNKLSQPSSRLPLPRTLISIATFRRRLPRPVVGGVGSDDAVPSSRWRTSTSLLVGLREGVIGGGALHTADMLLRVMEKSPCCAPKKERTMMLILEGVEKG